MKSLLFYGTPCRTGISIGESTIIGHFMCTSPRKKSAKLRSTNFEFQHQNLGKRLALNRLWNFLNVSLKMSLDCLKVGGERLGGCLNIYFKQRE